MARVKPSEQNKTWGSQSSDKLLLIFQYLAQLAAPLRLQDISAGLGIPQPTVLRYLNTLVNNGYVYKDGQTLRYFLTWRVCRLGHQVMSRAGLRDIVAPFLREIAQRFGSGACTVVRNESELLYLDIVEHPGKALITLQRLGKSAPMHTTGSGKMLLSGLSDAEIERFVNKNGLERYTKNTIVTLPALLEEVRRARSEGYAIDDEECEEGIRCVSVPLYDYTDQLAAAISVFGVPEALNNACIQNEIIPAMLDVSRRVSARLGYDAV